MGLLGSMFGNGIRFVWYCGVGGGWVPTYTVVVGLGSVPREAVLSKDIVLIQGYYMGVWKFS